MEPQEALAADLQEAFAHVYDRGDALGDDDAMRVAGALMWGGSDIAPIETHADLHAAYRSDIDHRVMFAMPTTMTIADVMDALGCQEAHARSILAGMSPMDNSERAALYAAFRRAERDSS